MFFILFSPAFCLFVVFLLLLLLSFLSFLLFFIFYCECCACFEVHLVADPWVHCRLPVTDSSVGNIYYFSFILFDLHLTENSGSNTSFGDGEIGVDGMWWWWWWWWW